MHDVTIREAAMSDVEPIASLSGELGYPTSVDEMRPRLERMLADHETAIFVADDADIVVAWINVSVMRSLEAGEYAQIRGLVVSESMRGRGIGALLVARAEEWARDRGMLRMRVQSNTIRTRTHRFYEREGYATKKEQKVFEKAL